MKNTAQNPQTKLYKLIILFAAGSLIILLIVGLFFTFAYKNLLKKQRGLEVEQQQIEREIDDFEKDNDFLTGKDDEVIIKH